MDGISVEEAFEKVLSWEFGTDPERYRVRDYIQADLDVLVREVRCEIPCQRAPWRIIPGATYILDDCSAHPDDLCITCTARAEREALKV